MLVITEPLYVLRDLLVWLWRLVTGQRRHRHEHAIRIHAPVATVWAVLRAPDITYDGMFPLRMVTRPVPGMPGVDDIALELAGHALRLRTRLLDERPGHAILLEVLKDGTSPEIYIGAKDYLGMVVESRDGATTLFGSREVTPDRLLSGMLLGVQLRSGLRRYKTKAEALAKETLPAATGDASLHASGEAGARSNTDDGPPDRSPASPNAGSSLGLTPNSIIISLIAFASFAYLWGWQEALLLTAIIILHEAGHAIAMPMVGMQLRGIFLVPFFGGVAVAKQPFRSEWQLGFVALMGPAVSLITTAALVFAYRQSGEPLLKKAAEMSAIVNLLNLAPIIPLDGGNVLKATLISLNRTLAYVVGLAGIAAGFWIAWVMRDPIIGLFVALGLLITRQIPRSTALAPMSGGSAFGLFVAFLATIAVYLWLILLLLGRRLPF